MSSDKTCKVCNRQDVEFYKNRRICKGCYSKRVQDVYAQTEKGHLIRHKARKKYNKTERAAINRKAYFKKNPNAREAALIRKGCWNFVKGKNATAKFRKHIGCTSSEFRQYIESLFILNMSWQNYGSVWHIDHIMPLNLFNLLNEKQFAQACHFTNTRPLFKVANLKRPRKTHPSFPTIPLHAVKEDNLVVNIFEFATSPISILDED